MELILENKTKPLFRQHAKFKIITHLCPLTQWGREFNRKKETREGIKETRKEMKENRNMASHKGTGKGK